MGWLIEALEQGILRVSRIMNCPYHNPENRADVPTKLNACKNHLWASKEWLEGYLNNLGDSLENYEYELID